MKVVGITVLYLLIRLETSLLFLNILISVPQNVPLCYSEFACNPNSGVLHSGGVQVSGEMENYKRIYL